MWESVASVGLYVVFWLIIVLSVVLIPLGIPGTFIIVGVTLVHAFATGFVPFSWWFISFLVVLAAIGEIVEFFLGAFTAKRFGGSKRAMWGAILGGFIGAIVATAFLPVIGTLLGAFAGAFIGAALLEYTQRSDFETAMRVGTGAFLGSVGGKMTKIILAVTMATLIANRLLT